MNGLLLNGLLLNGLVAAQPDLLHLIRSPIVWGLAIGTLGLWVIFSNLSERARHGGKILATAGLIMFAVAMPKLSSLDNAAQWGEQLVFWLFAGTAVLCSGAAITARSPVYCAIWFAASLLGVAGLFLFQHAQFLGVATIVVYAGAIVVTFLFVLMLASPQGKDRYDQISWSSSAIPLALAAGLVLVVIVLQSFSNLPATTVAPSGLNTPQHMARLGQELFARHLLEVEVGATILLVALVGAVAMVIHDRERLAGDAASDEASGVGGAQS